MQATQVTMPFVSAIGKSTGASVKTEIVGSALEFELLMEGEASGFEKLIAPVWNAPFPSEPTAVGEGCEQLSHDQMPVESTLKTPFEFVEMANPVVIPNWGMEASEMPGLIIQSMRIPGSTSSQEFLASVPENHSESLLEIPMLGSLRASSAVPAIAAIQPSVGATADEPGRSRNLLDRGFADLLGRPSESPSVSPSGSTTGFPLAEMQGEKGGFAKEMVGFLPPNPLQSSSQGQLVFEGTLANGITPQLNATSESAGTSASLGGSTGSIPMISLPTGQAVPEHQVVNQVVGRIGSLVEGEVRSLTLKLYPKELGEVTLDLVIEKDRVKAQLVAQNQQVQDVLEKHLPKLRSALENQGLKPEVLQVTSDSQNNGERGFSRDHKRTFHPIGFAVRNGESGTGAVAELASSASILKSGGINLRI